MVTERKLGSLRAAPLLEQLRYAKDHKGTIHTLGLPDVTAALAEYDIYTTTTKRHPGRFFTEHRPGRKGERINKRYAKRAYKELKDTPEFRDAIKERCLGETLAASFQTISGDIVFQTPSVLDPKKGKEKPDGTFAYEKVIFSAPLTEKTKLAIALQVLPRAHESSVTVVTYDDPASDSSKIELRNSTEHTARYISRIVGAIKQDEDRRRTSKSEKKITLPQQKSSLVYLEEELGETLPPQKRADEIAMNEAYREIRVLIKENETNMPVEVTKWPNKLVTDDAPVFQAWREGFKNQIEERRGAHRNPEQDPQAKRRPLIEEDIRLKRKRVRLKDIEAGPASSRPLSPLETAVEATKEFFQDLKGKPWETIPDVIVKPLLGKIELVVKSVPYALKTGIAAGYLGGDIYAWIQQRRAAKADDRMIKDAISGLIIREEQAQKGTTN